MWLCGFIDILKALFMFYASVYVFMKQLLLLHRRETVKPVNSAN